MPSSNESVFVFGAVSANYRISLSTGEIVDGQFMLSAASKPVYFDSPSDDYYVGRIPSGLPIGIVSVNRQANPEDKIGRNFAACGKIMKTIVFELPPGTIVYLGDIYYHGDERSVGVNYSRDSEAARKFVESHYPQFKQSLEERPVQMLPTSRPCQR